MQHSDSSEIEVTDPDSPLFEIWVNGRQIADLIEPAYEEMFWCSYRVVPLDVECRDRLRNYDLWDQCGFEIRSPATGEIVGVSLAAGCSFKAYCEGLSPRIEFRSLWPPRDRIPKKPLMHRIKEWLKLNRVA